MACIKIKVNQTSRSSSA